MVRLGSRGVVSHDTSTTGSFLVVLQKDIYLIVQQRDGRDQVKLSGGLVLAQQNILNAHSGSANQVTQVVNLDATEISAVKVKWWPSFQRDVL